MSDTKRIILDLSPEAKKEVDSLKKNIGVKNRAELVRLALGLLAMATKYQNDKYTMQFKKENEVVSVAMPLLGKNTL